MITFSATILDEVLITSCLEFCNCSLVCFFASTSAFLVFLDRVKDRAILICSKCTNDIPSHWWENSKSLPWSARHYVLFLANWLAFSLQFHLRLLTHSLAGSYPVLGMFLLWKFLFLVFLPLCYFPLHFIQVSPKCYKVFFLFFV